MKCFFLTNRTATVKRVFWSLYTRTFFLHFVCTIFHVESNETIHFNTFISIRFRFELEGSKQLGQQINAQIKTRCVLKTLCELCLNEVNFK